MTVRNPAARVFITTALALLALPIHAQNDTPAATTTPKAQAPADQRAYKAARALTDPEQKLAALRQFVHDYPKSNRVDRADTAIFSILLASGPQREPEIQAEAKYLVKHAGKDDDKWSKENEVAYDLAEAAPNGIDLPLAEKWAKDSVKHETEAVFGADFTAMFAKYKMPSPEASEVHDQFAKAHAGTLQTLADVYFHEGKIPEATETLAEAYALNPKDDGVNSLMGQIALSEHRDAEALDDFKRAQLFGGLKPLLRDKMMDLYRASHHGSDAGFLGEQDARYNQLFPAPFTPAPHKPILGGHPVLVELYTGSACRPCVGADLAVEGILETWPRSEVIALAFDQHIPEPDPLTNPASDARATINNVTGTPTFIVDGKLLEPEGGRRPDSEKLYQKMVAKLEPLAAKPSPIGLKLTAVLGPDGQIQAHATVTLPNPTVLQDQIAADPVPDTPKKPADPAPAVKTSGKKTNPTPSASPVPSTIGSSKNAPPDRRLTLNFALVEDKIRYPGENGIRFHRMVVRSLAKPSNAAYPLEPSTTATLDCTFDLQQITKTNSEYLAAYAKQNERYENVEFLSTDTAMQPNHLAIAAWVQDDVTHRVLQSAFTQVGESTRASKE